MERLRAHTSRVHTPVSDESESRALPSCASLQVFSAGKHISISCAFTHTLTEQRPSWTPRSGYTRPLTDIIIMIIIVILIISHLSILQFSSTFNIKAWRFFSLAHQQQQNALSSLRVSSKIRFSSVWKWLTVSDSAEWIQEDEHITRTRICVYNKTPPQVMPSEENTRVCCHVQHQRIG